MTNRDESCLDPIRRAQHRARVENPARVEGALDGPHQLERCWITISFKIGHLEPADAMLGCDRAAKSMNQIMNGTFDLFSKRLVIVPSSTRWWKDIVVQIAVTQMTKGVDSKRPEGGNCRVSARQKGGDFCNRQADVMV